MGMWSMAKWWQRLVGTGVRGLQIHKTELNERYPEVTANPQVSVRKRPFAKEREATKIPGICVSCDEMGTWVTTLNAVVATSRRG